VIDDKTYSIEWINDLRNKIGKRIDPKLIEKVIYALSLLEQLQLKNLDFVFKGGTALLLTTPVPKRFSIDIDIITEVKSVDIERVLNKIIEAGKFLRWTDDNERIHSADAPIGHYKLFYQSKVDGREEPILLDVLYAPNPYVETQKIPIKHNWLITSEKDTIVEIPTFDAILGDKLTAFAPNTTGILYAKNRPVEIVKQLFDIAFLFDRASDIKIVKETFDKIAHEEIVYRNLSITTEEVLEDTWNTCFLIATRDTSTDAFKQIQLGLRNFVNFTVDRFSIEEAVTASAKAAYLTRLLYKDDAQKIEKFISPLEIKDWVIENSSYNKLNKLRKNNPEAFFYWYKSFLCKPPMK
jgi:hypothetical protein